MSKNYGNDSQMSEIVKYISDTMKFPIMGAGGGFAPIGTINSYMGTIAPIGWLACDGTVYNIADYPDLATHIASHFGSTNFFGGDGTTTFGVPDLRGEFLRGTGTNSHTNTELGATEGNGANVGVHQNATVMPNAWCDGSNFGLGGKNETGGSVGSRVQNKDSKKYTYWSRYLDNTSTWTQDPDGYGSIYTSRPTNTSVLFIIKATVAGDPNAHQYSTEEQVVGTWIDGKPIYEMTYSNVNIETTFNSNVGAGEGTLTDSSLANIDVLIDCRFIGKQTKNSDITVCNSVNAQHRTSNTLFMRTPSDNNYIQHVIINYTKTSS